MRSLITGANGFLGSHLVRHLLERGHTVTVLLRPGADLSRISSLLADVLVVEGSMEDQTTLEETLVSNPVDVAFHLAWAGVAGIHRNHVEISIANLVGSLRLAQRLQASGCRHLVVTGSQAEYGPKTKPLTEEMPTMPQTAYGASKLALSVLLRQMCHSTSMDLSWVRILSLYGPGDDVAHMVPSLIAALLRGERPSLTAGEQIWDYLYVEDAAEALCLLAERRLIGTFNLGSGIPLRLREFVMAVRNAIDPHLPLGFGEVDYRPDQVMHLVADIGRISQASGWHPRTELRQGIEQTIAWVRSRSDSEERN